MGMYEDGANEAAIRVIIETEELPLLLREISRWQKIKSKRSTIVLQTKQDEKRYRLILADYEPVVQIIKGWNQYDLGDIFPSMKADW